MMLRMLLRSAAVVTTSILLVTPSLASTDAGIPSGNQLSKLYPGKAYSPWAKRAFATNVYWGDTHLHTGLSLDAGLFGNTLEHDAAYRFARGEEVVSSSGLPVKLSRPLDWLVVTDHSDMMGLATDIQNGTPNILAIPEGKRWHQAFRRGGQDAANAAFELISAFSQFKVPEKMVTDYSPGSTQFAGIWEDIIDAAERYNDPGHFTAFIGYEWTSVPQGFNLHRNVVFRDGAARAKQVVPLTTQPPIGSTDPLDLYRWMGDYETKTGGQVLAIAHNGNLSNGWMFPIDKTYAGGQVNEEYVTQRARWEPLYEVTQIKGDGETHPVLSPDDEFADYGTWDVGNLDLSQLKKDTMLAGEYARAALKNGMVLKNRLGTNPYKFGMVGATDSHTSLATADSDNFWSKSVSVEPSPDRINHPFVSSDLGTISGDMLVASGYQGIWAPENTREALFDAMMRKETYATTGPRMIVRFFGGWNFTEADLNNRQLAFTGYSKGVPMGADLPERTDAGKSSPSFMMYALRDPIGANLDRLQIVKGWVDKTGKTHERVYNVAWSGEREISSDGKLPPVGNTVNAESANWTNTIGNAELMAVWSDPDFDPNQDAFYYGRVLEIPTPLWYMYDKVRLGAEIPEDLPTSHQERAYTSPIWYTSGG